MFSFGPLQITFRSEALLEYTIDLSHFGSTPGVFSLQQQKEKAGSQVIQSITDFKNVIDWLKEKADRFSAFCQITAE